MKMKKKNCKTYKLYKKYFFGFVVMVYIFHCIHLFVFCVCFCVYYYAKSNFRNVFHKTFNLTKIQSTNNVWDLERQVRKEKAIKNKQWKHNYYDQVTVYATDDSNSSISRRKVLRQGT